LSVTLPLIDYKLEYFAKMILH